MHLPQALSLDQNNVTLCTTKLRAQNRWMVGSDTDDIDSPTHAGNRSTRVDPKLFGKPSDFSGDKRVLGFLLLEFHLHLEMWILDDFSSDRRQFRESPNAKWNVASMSGWLEKKRSHVLWHGNVSSTVPHFFREQISRGNYASRFVRVILARKRFITQLRTWTSWKTAPVLGDLHNWLIPLSLVENRIPSGASQIVFLQCAWHERVLEKHLLENSARWIQSCQYHRHALENTLKKHGRVLLDHSIANSARMAPKRNSLLTFRTEAKVSAGSKSS